MLKPTKKQKAIVVLLDKIDYEGLEFSMFFGVEDLLNKIGDDNLIQLVEKFDKAYDNLNLYIDKLEEEVKPFRDDDSDF